jgi:ADP-heptose:LPS heptosyltransferase
MEEYSDLHYSQRCLKSLTHFGYRVPENPPRPELFLDPKSEQYVNSILKGKSNFILINISASNEAKMWSNQNWIEFIKFVNKSKEELLLIYPPSSEESAKRIISQSQGIAGIKSNTMQDSFSIISRAKLLITPDTSLVHVASAYNIPLLALYSGLDDFYSKFRPLSEMIEVVRSEKGDGSIRSIAIDAFVEAYQRIIKKISH